MYNEAKKAEYLKMLKETNKDADIPRAVTVLKRSEKYETSLGKDLSEFTAEELDEFIHNEYGMTKSVMLSVKSAIKGYTAWTVGASGIKSSEVVNRKFSQTDSKYNKDRVRANMLKDPKDLQEFLDKICSPEEEQGADNIIRVYCWMLYGGIPTQEITEIKKSDVNLLKLYIKHDGKFYPIYKEAILAFMNCCELEAFRYEHPLYTDGKARYKPRVPGDCLLRGTRNGVISYNDLKSRFVRIQQKHISAGAKKLSALYIRKSGAFYRAYLDGMEGVFSEDFSCYGLLNDDGLQEYSNKKYTTIKSDYRFWVECFYPEALTQDDTHTERMIEAAIAADTTKHGKKPE